MQLFESARVTNQRWKIVRQLSARTSTWLAVFLLPALFAVPTQAQFRTSIQGTVTDSSGAVIPGATLTLTNAATNETVVRTSNDEGIFNFNALPAAHFNLVVEKDGFKKKVLNDLQLIPEQANALTIQMELGSVTQSVSVNASLTPAMDTETANNTTVISSNQIDHMITFGRDVFQLSQLAPGAFSDGAQSGGGGTFNLPGNQGPGGSGSGQGIFQTENGPQLNANGGHVETNSISIDGISTVSAVWGGTTVITPTEESVASVKISTNEYDAENGRFSGAVTQVTSKSGSNEYHGSAFFTAHRPGLNAYQRYNGPSTFNVCDTTSQTPCALQKGLNRDGNLYNQFGGSVGGPFWKNKLFGFFAYEGMRENHSVPGTGWYDTTAFDGLAPSGSIASKYLTFPGAAVVSSGIIPQTCTSAGLIENTSCITIAGQGLNIGSPMTSPLHSQDPTWTSNPNQPGLGGGLSSTVADIADYNTVNPTTIVYAQYNGRLDADVTSKDHAAFAVYVQPMTKSDYNGGDRAYNLFNHNEIHDALSLIWNHTFSPTLLNEARANAAGWRYNEIASNPQSPVGLPQLSWSPSAPGSTGLNQLGSALGSDLDQWTFEYKDVATKVSNRHTVKFGGELTRLYFLNNPVGRPNYNFYNVWDFLNDAPNEESGNFNTVTGFPGANRQDVRANIFGFFVQDDWKFRPNLTVNLGLRYEYYGSIYDKQNNLSIVEFGTGANYLTGINMRQGGNAWSPQKGNFGPQIGFNWSPDLFKGKLVLRGGYGLNYNQEMIAISTNIDANPPGAGYYDFASASPAAINPDIIYGISSSPTSLNGFVSNPHTITLYNAQNLPVGGNAFPWALPANIKTAYSEHYSLTTEYNLGHDLVASLGYQGSSAHHLITWFSDLAVAAATSVAFNPLITNEMDFGNYAASNNNEMLAELKHQFAHRYSANAQFAWAKSMDNGSGPYFINQYPYNHHASYGRSDFNIGKSLKLYGLWQPVIFHGSQNWMEKAVGGWSLSGIMTLHTGFGWTPKYPTDSLYFPGAFYNGGLQPTYLGGAGSSTSNSAFESTSANYPGIDTGAVQGAHSYSNKYFSMADYSAAEPNAANVGGASDAMPPPPGLARNSFNGPGYRDIDLSLTKAFGLPKARVLGENGKVEIRMDAYNLFNLLNINTSSISANINAPNFGLANSGLGSRTISFQARFSF
ncbi:MAG: TonB-dependent receptor [Terracidiphilus sp.]|jgi:hypothetical protein